MFCISACGNASVNNRENRPANSSGAVTSDDTGNAIGPVRTGTSDIGVNELEILVVYYSATGCSQNAAEYIADLLGADLFELNPLNPYSDADLNDRYSSRVVKEYNDPALQDIELVSTTVDNWDDYVVVFVGYPIWRGIAAWQVNRFIKFNNFSGKTVIPFCTSASSAMGESSTLLKEMAASGDWQEGIRFRSDVTKSEIRT